MLRANCPSCSMWVHPEQQHCPSCGVDVSFTVAAPAATANGPSTVALLDFLPGQSFAKRFTIIERIGAGGMGVVYKAIDTALDTVVALKLIQPVLACSRANVERFRREVRMTRQITHPNICRIHDIGNDAGVMFLSMEWIEGETLQQLLRQTGMLKEGRALEVAEEIAEALEAAHAAGIVHRDLKPANVMINRRGRVSVLDFGLALERGEDQRSGACATVGTPRYMAPEQREGRAVDERADLYALGLLLWEMLTGTRASTHDGTLPSLPEQINPLVAPVLARLLAAEPDDRFDSAVSVRRALRELIAHPEISTPTPSLAHPSSAPVRARRRPTLVIAATATALVVFAAAALLYGLSPRTPPAQLGAEARVFYDRGLHYLREESEYLPSLDDAIHMFHRALDLEPDSALLHATLAEAYWMRFERTLRTSSRQEAERALEAARRLDPDLPEVRYAAALGLMAEGKFQAARAELETVLDDRPRFTMAWVNLGLVGQKLGDYAGAKSALDRAMRLEPGSFRVQLYYGLFHEAFQEYEAALDYFRRATELKPDSGIAWNNLGAAFLFTSRFDEAIPALLRSIEIEDNAHARSNLGTSYYFRGDFEQAVDHYRRATELQPREAVQWGNLGDGLVALQRTDEARQAYRHAADLARERVSTGPLDAQAIMDLAVYCAKAGEADCARRQGSRAIELMPDNGDLLLRHATILVLIGEETKALDALDRAVRLGASRAQIEATPEFAPFAGHPRFQAILELAS